MREYRNDIEKYLEGKLTPSEMHALEKAALDDPFLADALDGATQLNAADFSNDVIALNKKITARKSSSTWAWPMRIAAALLVLFVASFIIWFALDEQPQHELALEKNIPTKEETATDSVVKQHTEPLSAAPQVPVFTPPASREGKKAKTSETLKPQPQVAKDEPSIVIPSAAHREEAEAMSEVATAIAGEAADKKNCDSSGTKTQSNPGLYITHFRSC